MIQGAALDISVTEPQQNNTKKPHRSKKYSWENHDRRTEGGLKHEGAGYTTEGAAAVLERGREKLEITSVYGITLPHNTRSIRVLEKLGLEFVEEKSLDSGAPSVRIFRGSALSRAPEAIRPG